MATPKSRGNQLSFNTALPLRAAESQFMMLDKQVNHEADAATSIRQARSR